MVKGPKLLNPADKARKEARKKELKKNKKQRQQIRSAAIERKDPEQVISDLEKLDRFEFDLATNPTISDSFYKDKRKRLKETWSKILSYYLKEDPERHAKLKKLETEYEVKHKKLAREFEGIKAAQEVKIEDVFLPPESDSAIDEITDDDPLLSESMFVTAFTEGIKPPGCPPGLPPDLKQIVDSLKTSLTTPISLEQLALPANLMNLGVSQQAIADVASKNFQKPPYRNQSRPDSGQYSSSGQLNFKQSRNPAAHIRTDPSQAETKTNVGQAKTAVIESKPVIFMQKATKFVPSSVRKKKLTKDD